MQLNQTHFTLLYMRNMRVCVAFSNENLWIFFSLVIFMGPILILFLSFFFRFILGKWARCMVMVDHLFTIRREACIFNIINILTTDEQLITDILYAVYGQTYWWYLRLVSWIRKCKMADQRAWAKGSSIYDDFIDFIKLQLRVRHWLAFELALLLFRFDNIMFVSIRWKLSFFVFTDMSDKEIPWIWCFKWTSRITITFVGRFEASMNHSHCRS